MAQSGQLVTMASTDGEHFTEALATNQAEAEHGFFSGFLQGRKLGRLRSLIVWSSQNLAWEFAFYRRTDTRSPNPNFDAYLGGWRFTTADGQQIEGAGLYRYYIDGLDILLEDDEDRGQVHVELINRSAAPKASYGAGGHFRAEGHIEMMLGW